METNWHLILNLLLSIEQYFSVHLMGQEDFYLYQRKHYFWLIQLNCNIPKLIHQGDAYQENWNYFLHHFYKAQYFL